MEKSSVIFNCEVKCTRLEFSLWNYICVTKLLNATAFVTECRIFIGVIKHVHAVRFLKILFGQTKLLKTELFTHPYCYNCLFVVSLQRYFNRIGC